MQPPPKRRKANHASDLSLSDLITMPRTDWDAVMERLETHPEEATKKGMVIVALCNELTPVPADVLLRLLQHIPLTVSDDGLGYACSNPNVTAEVLVILLELEKPDLQEVDALVLCAIDDNNRVAIKTFLNYAPELLRTRDKFSSNLFMHYACSTSGFSDSIRYLIEESNRANIGGPTFFSGLFCLNAHYISPLHLLCKDGRNFDGLVDFLYEECRFLLSNPEVSSLLISTATHLNDIKSAEKIYSRSPSCIERIDHKGQLPLHKACAKGHVEMIRFLLKKGNECNPHTRNSMLLSRDFSLISPLECVLSGLFEEDQVTERQAYWDCLEVCLEYLDPLHVLRSSIGFLRPEGIKHLFNGKLKKISHELVAPAIIIAIECGTVASALMCFAKSRVPINDDDETFRKTMSVLVDLYLEQFASNHQAHIDFHPLHCAVKAGLSWNKGLAELVRLERSAMMKPEENMLPFMLACARCDLDTINELVRLTVSISGRVKEGCECEDCSPCT